MNTCPVCNNTADIRDHDYGDKFVVECPNCGDFEISGTAETVLENRKESGSQAKLGHWLRKMQSQEAKPLLTSTLVKSIISETTLPDHIEQSQNLIRWLGEKQVSYGKLKKVRPAELIPVLGFKTVEDVNFVVGHLIKKGIVESPDQHLLRQAYRLGLSFEGWDKFDEIRSKGIESKIVFMAMEYGDPQLDDIYKTCFRPAVSQTGFDLRRLDDHPKAGLIDNHLRVAIRDSRLLLADLTHRNPGAYWEAGFAEGLGKPVIYLCEKPVFKEKGTHFDTNHCQTVVWDPDNLPRAAADLKATIRATLPEETILSDEEG